MSRQNWLELSNRQKHEHKLENCHPRNIHHLEYAMLQKSVHKETNHTNYDKVKGRQ